MSFLMQAEKGIESILKILNKKVVELPLSVRAENCLREADIIYVRDLIRMKAEDLLGLKNFGIKSLKEIEGVLEEIGLTLGMTGSMIELKSHYQTEMATKLMTPSPQSNIKGPHQTLLGVELLAPSVSTEFKNPYDDNLIEAGRDISSICFLKVEDLDLTVRAAKCLKDANIIYIGDLVIMSERDLLSIRNLGSKSLREIKKKLSMLKLDLGIKVEKWPPDNIEKSLKSYAHELKEERMRLVERLESENIKNKKGFDGEVSQATNLEEELSNLANPAGSARNKKNHY
jgi:DNA-directed RNA polymerase alpha subunit